MAVFKQYDPNMLGASVDEAYLKYVFSSSTSMIGEGNVVLMALSPSQYH
jgi:hypothetical protein